MALDDKKYERVFSTSGSDADKITSTELSEMKRVFDDNEYINDKGLLQGHGYILYQMQLLTEEIDSLRNEISTNKSKSTFPGFGTSGTTALVGNTTVISSSQASAITANTAKITFPVGYGTSGHALTFGVNKKGTSLIITNTFTEKGKTVTKSTTIGLK